MVLLIMLCCALTPRKSVGDAVPLVVLVAFLGPKRGIFATVSCMAHDGSGQSRGAHRRVDAPG